MSILGSAMWSAGMVDNVLKFWTPAIELICVCIYVLMVAFKVEQEKIMIQVVFAFPIILNWKKK